MCAQAGQVVRSCRNIFAALIQEHHQSVASSSGQDLVPLSPDISEHQEELSYYSNIQMWPQVMSGLCRRAVVQVDKERWSESMSSGGHISQPPLKSGWPFYWVLASRRWAEGLRVTCGLGHNTPCVVSDAHSFSIMTLEVMREDDGFRGCKETGSLSSHLEDSSQESFPGGI